MTAFSPRGPHAPGKLDAGIDFRLLEAVIQNSNDSVVITAIEPGSDGRRRITWVNPAFSRITGYSAEEAIGQSASFLFNPDKSSPGFRNLLDATRSRQIGHAELELERKDGSHYWLELNVVPVTATDLESQPMVTISRDITERKRLEQAMREQEEFFRTLVENSRDMVSVLDLSGTVLFQSPASTQILGYTPAEMVGHNAAEYVHPDDKEQLYELAQAAHDPARASFSHEARFRHGDGRWLVLEVVGRTITDRSGQPVWILNSRDVTERRQAEDALRTSEQRFRDFAEVASDWFWEQDANLRFTYVSPGVTAVTGRAVSDIIGTTREELYRFDSADPVWAEHRRTIANHEPFENFRYSRVGPNGRLTHRQISGRPIFDDDGKFLGYRGVGRDVTAEVEAEQRATQAERQLRNALDSISEGFTLYDENDVLVLQNRRSVMFYPELAGFIVPGARYEDIMRNIAFSGRVPAAKGRAEEWLKERMALHRNNAGGTELERQLADGCWVKISERPTSQGGVVIIQSDITETKQRQQALAASEATARRAREAAEAASRAKSAFLASMSHELRTPLNAILGFAETMSHQMFGPLGAPKYIEYAQDIHQSGAHLLALINDILDLSRIEAGRYDLNLEAVNPESLVEEAVRLVSVNVARAGISLEVETAAELPAMLLDRRAIHQVLLNLLSNAIKFTKPGGRVSVTTGIDLGILTIAVADTGIGIPASALSRLAKPFEQVANVMTRRNEGSGLGLAISKALVEFHHGSLEIDSALDVGTTVTVRLPYDTAVG